MTCMIQRFSLAAFLSIGLLSAPAQAQDKSTPEPGGQNAAVLKKLDELQRSLTAMQKQLDKQLTATDVDLQIQNALRDANNRVLDELETLRRRVDKFEKDLRVTTNSSPVRVSAYPQAPASRIRLVNTFVTPMTILVNDKSYRLSPGETQLVEGMPVGRFTFEVLGYHQGPQARELAANDTYTITVYPR